MVDLGGAFRGSYNNGNKHRKTTNLNAPHQQNKTEETKQNPT